VVHLVEAAGSLPTLGVCGRVLTTEVMSPPGPANASYRLEMALDANAF
jgi:hypothetical protein